VLREEEQTLGVVAEPSFELLDVEADGVAEGGLPEAFVQPGGNGDARHPGGASLVWLPEDSIVGWGWRCRSLPGERASGPGKIPGRLEASPAELAHGTGGLGSIPPELEASSSGLAHGAGELGSIPPELETGPSGLVHGTEELGSIAPRFEASPPGL